MVKTLSEKHNFLATLKFKAKVRALQVIRAWRDALNPVAVLNQGNPSDYPFLLASSVSALWDLQEPKEYLLTLGKVQNLRVAIQKLQHTSIPKGSVFSFWRQVGRLTQSKGYTVGRELREGCLVPSIGGGICQLSNALYDLALQAQFEIVERHAHTKVMPNSLALQGRDATVFWNYVDFRFRADVDSILKLRMDANTLHLELWGKEKVAQKNENQNTSVVQASGVNACDLCGQLTCVKALNPSTQLQKQRVAYVLDDVWPEYQKYLSAELKESDEVLLAFDGKRWNKKNYFWEIPQNIFKKIKLKTAHWQTLFWAFQARKLKSQGRARQLALRNRDTAIAKKLAKHISPLVTHCVVQQNFLSTLFATGVLAGRTFDVLMTRLPLKTLQDQLDQASQAWPQSKTLADYRVDHDAIALESVALQQAQKMITPHQAIAKLFPDKALLLPWNLPTVSREIITRFRRGSKVVFPASSVGRKGIYFLRELIQVLDVSVVVVGDVIEAPNFWQGLKVEQKPWSSDWWQDAAVFVLPAVVEFKPRALLFGMALGVPILASPACGLPHGNGVTIVAENSMEEWQKNILQHVAKHTQFKLHDERNE